MIRRVLAGNGIENNVMGDWLRSCCLVGRRLGQSLMFLGALVAAQGKAHADPASLTVVAQRPLNFGTLMVPSSGSRTLGSDGSISDSGVIAISGEQASPAEFAITYDRGSENNRSINIMVQVFLSGGQTTSTDGVEGRLSLFDTDLALDGGLSSGATGTFTITDCRERRCTQTFRVGARLDVDRSFGGATMIFPLPVTATVLAVY